MRNTHQTDSFSSGFFLLELQKHTHFERKKYVIQSKAKKKLFNHDP